MTPAHEEAQRLLRLALRDRDTFELLLPLPQASVAAIGFHAQQSIEKALKAIGLCMGWKCAAPMIWWLWRSRF